MALTKAFKNTVQSRAEQDPKYRYGLLTDSIESMLSGDIETGKLVLRDYIKATIGFEALADLTQKPAKSLMRMLSPSGNPTASNLFSIISKLRLEDERSFSVQCNPPKTPKKKPSLVGLKRARMIGKMPYQDRIDFIAEGLPLILKRAQALYADAQSLSESSASKAILINGAKEEAAKILILMDIIRSPKKRVARDSGKLMNWFYNHLARLIYADAIRWKPRDIPELKYYIREDRKTHYVDGEFGEYIYPNMALYQREAQMYVDVAILDSDKPKWVSPLHNIFNTYNAKPTALNLAEAMQALGLFSPKGLRLVADIWNKADFRGEEAPNHYESTYWEENTGQRAIGYSGSVDLMKELRKRLQTEGICTDADDLAHMGQIFNSWQLPMYDFDLSPIIVSQDELEDEQASLHPQYGDY